MALSKIASDTTFQAVGGSAIGLAVDHFFTSKQVDDTNFMMVGVELLAQLIADSFLTYTYFDFLTRRGYTSNGADQTRSVVYLLAFITSQPNLRSKMTNFIGYLQQRFNQTPLLVSKPNFQSLGPAQQANQQNGQTNQQYTQAYVQALTFQESDRDLHEDDD
jgi:hypothetical protein